MTLRRWDEGALRQAADARASGPFYPGSVHRRHISIPPWLRSAALVGAVVVAALVLITSHHGDLPRSEWRLTALSLLGAVTALAIGYRRWPVGLLCVICALALLDRNVGPITLPILIAMFNVALRCRRREIVVSAVVCTVGLLGGGVIHSTVGWDLQPILLRFVAVGLATAAGLYFAARRAYVASLKERADQLERERMLLADQAVAAERVRIARELHDVVAHSVSLMVVQAQALDALHDEARDAAAAQIASIGREALGEMHHMLDVLRPSGDEQPELAPAPGVRDVAALVERARGAGIDVALAVEGEPRSLPAGVDLSAYRIVQEALTNVIKHARALHTEVRIRYAAAALELSVVDDGTHLGDGGAPGHGLVGMRERVALFGGTLEAGRRSDGRGYAVHAVLPL
jgi:signal transduction histidine kinase